MSASPDLHLTPARNGSAPPAALPVEHRSLGHLSPDQIDDHLIGCLSAEAAAHLAACPLCARRAAAAAAPIASFRSITTTWSDRYSATLPIPAVPPQRPVWQRHLGWATACLTVAVGIALTTASQGWLAFGPSDPPPATLQTSQQGASQQITTNSPHVDQVSADNQMLQDIDSALDSSAETPSAFGLETQNDQPAAPPTSLQD